MQRLSGEWTIVVIGGWNLSIFQPDWVAKNLFEEEEIRVEVALVSGASQFSFIHNGISLVVNPSKLTISSENLDDKSINSCEECLKKIARLLPHTPVSAIGFNSGYIDVNQNDTLLGLISLCDTAKLAGEGCKIVETSIRRQLDMDERIINFRILERDGKFYITVNYHLNVESTFAILEIPDGEYLQTSKQVAKLLEKIYDMTLETEEDDE